MHLPKTHGTPTPAKAAAIVLAMLGMLVVPAIFALRSVNLPGKLVLDPNPSPHGYTWSLLLFVVPILTIGVWFLPSEGLDIPQRAFWRTIAVLVPIGWLLDVVFAQWFFDFPNSRATLGIQAPAFGRCVPVEEYVFYLTGFVLILLLYIWLSEYWLAAYTVADYAGEARSLSKLLQFHPMSLGLGLVLIALAIGYKKWISSVPLVFPATSLCSSSEGWCRRSASIPRCENLLTGAR